MAVKFEMSTKVERAGKERWHKVGVVMENDKGMYAIIDSIPVGFTGLVSFFVPKEKDAPTDHQQAKSNGYAPQAKSVADLSDDVPF